MLQIRRLAAFLVLVCAIVAGQPVAQVTVRDVSFQSASLGRAMKYRIILPAGYEQSARRYPVLYLLHGLTGNYLDWEGKTHLTEYAAPLPLIMVMPDAGDSWYTNSQGKPQDRFEDYIAKDLIPEIDKTYRTIATRHARAIAGLSMGGYGALKIALRYPGRFVFVADFSGALTVARDPKFNIPFGEKYNQQLVEIYGPPGSKTRAENDVFAIAEKLDAANAPYFWLACGTNDALLNDNRQFVALLQQRKIAYTYNESPGAHTWAFWDEHLPMMLKSMARHIELRPEKMPMMAPPPMAAPRPRRPTPPVP